MINLDNTWKDWSEEQPGMGTQFFGLSQYGGSPSIYFRDSGWGEDGVVRFSQGRKTASLTATKPPKYWKPLKELGIIVTAHRGEAIAS